MVKNVAGYDLTKLHVGGFGGFGVITEVNLRLRARPSTDITLVTAGGRHALSGAGRQLVEAHAGVAAMELLSPAWAAQPEWALALRLSGTEAGIVAEVNRVAEITGLEWERMPVDKANAFWTAVARAPLASDVTIRLGALLDGVDDAIDLVLEVLGEGMLSAGLGSGAIRWAGEVDAEPLRELRKRAAGREVPLTLERAPWDLRKAVGHFGAYREGVGQLVGRLRGTFDPKGTIAVALEGSE